MRNRVLRIAVVLIAVAAAATAAYTVWSIELQMSGERAVGQVLGDQARALVATVADARATQQAYVAQGQGTAYWTDRMSRLLPALDLRLQAFGSSLTSEAARLAFESAGEGVENLRKLDATARDYLQADQYLMASDLVFSDGIETAAATTAQIGVAMDEEILAREAALSGARRRQVRVLGAASGVLVLAILLLFPTGRRTGPSSSDELHVVPVPAGGDVLRAADAPGSPAPTGAIQPDLAGVADLCTDMGRVLETRDLSLLLGRAARLLDAAGLVVWIADPAGSALRPVIAHGYPDQALAKMGSIPREATNVTAAAYRAAELRVVNGEAGANGAVVAPLIAPGGCIGALATELRHGGERNEASRALVAIVAAQLSTIVAVPPAASGVRQAHG